MSRTVAALYVASRGCYYGLDDVEPWGLPDRDAREYAGPHPVVAHPPCTRWCRLAGLVEARWGYKRGDDGGCFAAALASVRRWGGYWSTRQTRKRGPRTTCRTRNGTADGRAGCAADGCATSSRGATATPRRRPPGCTPTAATCRPCAGDRPWTLSRPPWCRGAATARSGCPIARASGSAPRRRPRMSFATCYWRWRAARDHGECGARRARSSDGGCDE